LRVRALISFCLFDILALVALYGPRAFIDEVKCISKSENLPFTSEVSKATFSIYEEHHFTAVKSVLYFLGDARIFYEVQICLASGNDERDVCEVLTLFPRERNELVAPRDPRDLILTLE